jgi:hypothetical protein
MEKDFKTVVFIIFDFSFFLFPQRAKWGFSDVFHGLSLASVAGVVKGNNVTARKSEH